MNDPKLPVSGDQRDEQSNRAVVTATVEDRYVHSNVFARLVRDQNDLTGLVAYGLYKIRKREWIDKHESEQVLAEWMPTRMGEVASWHVGDLPPFPSCVRDGRNKGNITEAPKPTRMTRLGHRSCVYDLI